MKLLNKAYARDEGRCFGPIMFPGEIYAFYMNFDSPISDPDFENFRLDIVNAQTNVTAAIDIGQLEKDPITDDFYNIMCSFQCPALVFGIYFLAIVDPVADKIKCVSNNVILEEPALVKNTAFVAWRNTENRNNYRYEENPTWYNKIRLPLIQFEYRPETERKTYRNVTNRRIRNLKNYMDDVVAIESYFFDDFGHKQMAEIYNHDTIFVENTFVVPKEPYTKENNVRSIVAKGRVEVVVDEFQEAPPEAQMVAEFLVDHTNDEILANGDFIIVH